MKKLLLIATSLVLAVLPLRAQLTADAGYLHAFENTRVGNAKESSYLDGIYAGVRYNVSLYNLVEGLSLAPGANISALFGKYYDNADIRLQEVAVNIPLHAMYTLPVLSDLSLQFLAGPTFQLGIFHRGVDATSNPSQTYDFYKSYKVLGMETLPARNRFNVYLGLGVGACVADRFLVNLGFDFGLVNLSSGDNWNISRNVLKIGLGYIF